MVCFWGRQDIASNWNLTGFKVCGRFFNCNEQFVMFQKAELFRDFVKAKEIMDATDPYEHKKKGKEVKGFVEEIWHKHRRPIMVAGLLAKADQNLDVGAWIDGTGDMEIVEASPYDRIWGVGLAAEDPRIRDKSKWRGQNLLGQDWVVVRDIRRKRNQPLCREDNTPEPVSVAHKIEMCWSWSAGFCLIRPKETWLADLQALPRAELEAQLRDYAMDTLPGTEWQWQQFFYGWVLDNFKLDLRPAA
jgi:ribA/ribD-fused uncharacterized protein